MYVTHEALQQVVLNKQQVPVIKTTLVLLLNFNHESFVNKLKTIGEQIPTSQ